MKLGNFFKHLRLVIHHKHTVLVHCAKCGLLWRGLVHDNSKFSPEEFFESVRFYRGNRSPIGACRRTRGVSRAWLHHKGRNKHHLEYWIDPECAVPPMMPYKYAVECVCDKLAATKVYNGKSYTEDMALTHWLKYGNKAPANPRTLKFIEEVFRALAEHGEKYVLNKSYMKATYAAICGGGGKVRKKYLVMDLGNVMMRFSPKALTAKLVHDEDDARLVEAALFDRALWDRLDAGTISDDELKSAAKARLPERLWALSERVYDGWVENLDEIPEMRELVTRLKEKYSLKAALLSNTSRGFAEKEGAVSVTSLFDVRIYSAVCGYVKPSAEIYEHLCRTLEIEPDEAVFVDDNDLNVEGARAFGIPAILFNGDVRDLEAKLEEELAVK